MKYQPRDYQIEAANAALRAFERGSNGIIVLPTGSGKSVCISLIANQLQKPLLIFQPSKEILEQNYEKLRAVGYDDCSMYSASVGKKEISNVTFATIGSVKSHVEDFAHFKYVIIDECHLVCAKEGMYHDFLLAEKRCIVGLTATPYRLSVSSFGPMLKFITRTRPRIFEQVLHVVQTKDLVNRGYLASLRYFDLTNMDMTNLLPNSNGTEYSNDSILREFERIDFYSNLVSTVKRLLHPKSGIPRKGILVFTQFIKEAERLASEIDGCEIVTGETPKREREDILRRFRSGEVKVMANVGVLLVGFDYPALDTIVFARPTLSLAVWYQAIGRALRPSQGKDGWIVDLSGTYRHFGKVEDLVVEQLKGKYWAVTSNGKQLTNTLF